jgi:ABC-type multidrug transport system fused ATPase/permease subunit
MDVLRSAQVREYTFPGLRKEERILLVLRRHGFVLVTTGLLFAFLIVFPLVLQFLLPQGFLVSLQASVWGGVITLVLSAYYLFLWLFFFTVLVDYYLDVWIVTNERVVSILQEALFHRVIAEQSVIRVQDVPSSVRGIFPTFLNFGNVFIQTAGERERFVFMQLPNPEDVKKSILQAHEEAVRGLLKTDQSAMMQTGESYGSTHRSHAGPEVF